MGMIEKFQQDLRNGMTLEAALIKHNLSFKEAVEFCPRPMSQQNIKRKPRQKRNVYQKVDKHISLKKDAYHVRKHGNGKSYWGGSYDTLEEAQKVRDFLEKNGWNAIKVNEACCKYKIKRRRRTK